MALDLKSLLVNVAPTLAGMLGSPFAGMAVSALESAFGLTAGAGQDGITQVIQTGGMTPDIISNVRAADQKHAEIMSQQNIDLKKMSADYDMAMAQVGTADRTSARSLQVSTKSYTLPILSWIVISGFILVIALKMSGQISASDQTTGDLITTLRDAVIMVLSFYYGTSQGSQQKNDLLFKSTPTNQGDNK